MGPRETHSGTEAGSQAGMLITERGRKRGVHLFYKGVGGAELPNRITTVKKKSGERNITQDEEPQKHG